MGDDLSYGLNTLGPLCLWQCSKFVVRRMHRHLLDDIKIREQVEPTLLTSSALFDLNINLDYFYKTQEVVFLIFVSPYQNCISFYPQNSYNCASTIS